MPDLIENDLINMTELSKQNGKSALENLQAIMEILEIRSEIYCQPQKALLTFTEGKIKTEVLNEKET